MTQIAKTADEIKIMRHAGKLLKEVQQVVLKNIKPGVSLLELDRIAEDEVRSRGGVPSFKGFHGFPATLCTMINEEVVHGIPSSKTLEEGDLFTFDCGLQWRGYHADSAITVIVGGDDKNPERAKFSACVKKALLAGCKAAKAGAYTGDVGAVIEDIVTKGGYSICREYTGHGLGRGLHEEPHVYNYGPEGTGDVLLEGMTIAIEPIVAAGKPAVHTMPDQWTVVTKDGQDACQWEHFGVITKQGLEIFA